MHFIKNLLFLNVRKEGKRQTLALMSKTRGIDKWDRKKKTKQNKNCMSSNNLIIINYVSTAPRNINQWIISRMNFECNNT